MQPTYCPYCLSPVVPGQVCSGCGRDPFSYQPEAHHFPAGKLLAGRYYVGRALGEGGFGITYLGLDTKLKRRVAVKEYFPRTLVRREATTTLNVTCYTGSGDYFEKGREQFLQEAQTLAKLDDIPEIVHVLDFFPENNSAYIVMEFLEGITLKDLVGELGALPVPELTQLLEPVLKAMDTMHRSGLIHRDISPDNLMVMKKSGHVKLMDFGCAREIGIGHTMTVMLKPGFAPLEQSTGREQGPWTDVYAICATIYYCLTGVVPPEAMHRVGRDELIPPSQLGVDIPDTQEMALLKGMAVNVADRWHSMEQLYTALHGRTPAGVLVPDVYAYAASVNGAVHFAPQAYETAVNAQPWSQSAVAEHTGNGAYHPTQAAPYQQSAPVMEHTEYVPKGNFNGSGGYTEYVRTPAQQNAGQQNAVPAARKKIKSGILIAACAAVLLCAMGVFWLVHPHSYGAWKLDTDPTCVEAGLEVRRCFCGKSETRTVSASGHKRVDDAAVAATCVQPGLTEGSHCSVCNEVLIPQAVIAATGHNLAYLPVEPPTCTENGLSVGYGCTVCGYCEVPREEISALGHTVVNDPRIDATCTVDGMDVGSHCSVCYEILIERAKIPAYGHSEVKDPAKAATCTQDGVTEGSHCETCGLVMKEQSVIEAKGHQYSSGVCKVCGEAEGSQGLSYQLNSSADGYILVGLGSCRDKDIVIPSRYNGKPVTEIATYAFAAYQGYDGVETVVIPNSVTKIGDYIFMDQMDLEAVYIPSSVTKIGDELCSFCDMDKVKIYAEASSKPSGWSGAWSSQGYRCDHGYYSPVAGCCGFHVVWGYKR